MLADLRLYPSYEETGLPWLGRVPAHWKVRRAKSLFCCVDVRSAKGEEELLTVSSERGVVPRRTAAVTMFKAESYVGHKLCWPGDLVINSLWAWARGLGVSGHHGIVSSAYGVYRLRGSSGCAPRYVHQFVRSAPFNWELQVRSKGIWVSRLQLTDEAFLAAPLLVPPLQEQRAIVRFLGHADRRIKRYIRAKRRLIMLLEEQKQAIIQRAVTRGLDPNVRVKPSGVEWLGDVPEHWAVRKLGGLAVSFRTGPFGSILHQSDYIQGGTPLVNPTHIRHGNIFEDPHCTVPPVVVDRLSLYRLDRHDLLFSRRGELGRCALIRDREVGWVCGTGSIRVRIAYHGIEPEYLIQALQVRWVGEYLSLFCVGATMDSLNTGILKGIPVLIPPVHEQRQLLDRIVCETRRLDLATAEVKREVSLLREFRTRLIADVAMGKLDVREAAARLPKEGEDEEAGEEVAAGADDQETADDGADDEAGDQAEEDA